jgi:hypothetical protein
LILIRFGRFFKKLKSYLTNALIFEKYKKKGERLYEEFSLE